MAYFAELDKNNIVVQVIAISDEDAPNPAPDNSEPLGIAFIESLGFSGVWKQTSYNSNFRGNYASIGFEYRTDLDAFIAPQPFPSWVLNEETFQWDAPVPKPEGEFLWNEEAGDWVTADEAV